MPAIQQHTPTARTEKTIQEEKHQKVFFPNLDALRFICFFMVFLFHCYKTIFQNLKNNGGIDGTTYGVAEFLFQNGELGVNFFFVLSGFLITFLLIKEKELTGTVHLRNFYLRRILRIWPLFYLCIIIGFVVVPLLKTMSGQESSEIARPLYYILFANNFDYIASWPAFPDALILIVLWSVAVEEQFYITWPIILKFIPKKTYPVIFVVIILLTLLFRAFYTGDTDQDYAVRHFHTFAVIGDMALGGLMAYFCSYKSSFLRFVTHMSKGLILFIYSGAILIILFRHDLFSLPVPIIFERLVIASFFGFIILEQNFSNNSLFKFARLRTLSRLGLYTYGLYCLHFFVISLVQGGLGKIGFPANSTLTAVGAVLLSIIILIFICILSFNYFEKPFLKLKDRFAFIKRQ